MTVTTTADHFHMRRLPFLGMIRSRSNNSNDIMMKHHRLVEDNSHFCAALCDDEDYSSTDDSSTSSTISTTGGRNNTLLLPPVSENVPSPDAAPATDAAEAIRRPSASPTTVLLSPETPVLVKKVRFQSEEYNHIYENMELFKDECKELWYTPNDFKHFKKSVIHLAREITLAEQRNKAPCSYQRVMMRTYQACCNNNSRYDECNDTEATETCDEHGGGVLSDIEQRHLIRWMDVATTRLGVEKLSLRHVARDRILRRNEMMEVVFDIQEMFLTTTTTTTDNVDIGDDDNLDFNLDIDLDAKAEFIRNSCLTISRPSRLFAMHFAQALAASIHH